MNHEIHRRDISAVLPGQAKGIRRYNRRMIAEVRRTWMPKSVQTTVAQPKAPSQPEPRPWVAPRAVVVGYPNVYDYEFERKAKNGQGDCPQCGAFGAHPQIKMQTFGGAVVEVRQCRNCWTRFTDLPSVSEAATMETVPVVNYDDLSTAENQFQDCPEPGCGCMDVRETVTVRDSRTGTMKEVLRCRNRHLFKQYVRAVGFWM